MNKELLTRLQLEAGGSHYPTINPDMQQRFAELIIQECVQVLDSHEPLNTWTKRYSTLVKEHFGVEE